MQFHCKWWETKSTVSFVQTFIPRFIRSYYRAPVIQHRQIRWMSSNMTAFCFFTNTEKGQDTCCFVSLTLLKPHVGYRETGVYLFTQNKEFVHHHLHSLYFDKGSFNVQYEEEERSQHFYFPHGFSTIQLMLNYLYFVGSEWILFV